MGGMPFNPLHTLQQLGDEHHMFDRGHRIAIIRQVKISKPSGVLWRSVTGETNPADRDLLGYFPSLQMAAHVTWRMWQQRQTPPEKRQL
ncbi:hypothetical protein ACR5KS_02935 [Leucobacter sp. W1153]|uniref:hypothetical protein n=1 Tax=Leucobacter sp. W1153 TaxID=3439064 RepID=UPI003F2DB038